MDNATKSYGDLQQERAYKYITQEYAGIMIFMTSLGVIGTVGNAVTIAFYSNEPRRPITSLVRSLALTDLLVSISAFVALWETIMNVKLKSRVICKVVWFFYYWFIYCSILLVSVIANDRYRRLCRPFGRQFSRKSARYSIIGVWVLTMVIASRVFLTIDVIQTSLLMGKPSQRNASFTSTTASTFHDPNNVNQSAFNGTNDSNQTVETATQNKVVGTSDAVVTSESAGTSFTRSTDAFTGRFDERDPSGVSTSGPEGGVNSGYTTILQHIASVTTTTGARIFSKSSSTEHSPSAAFTTTEQDAGSLSTGTVDDGTTTDMSRVFDSDARSTDMPRLFGIISEKTHTPVSNYKQTIAPTEELVNNDKTSGATGAGLTSESEFERVHVGYCAFVRDPSIEYYVVGFHIADTGTVIFVIVNFVVSYASVVRTLIRHQKETKCLHQDSATSVRVGTGTRRKIRRNASTKAVSSNTETAEESLTISSDAGTSTAAKRKPSGTKPSLSAISWFSRSQPVKSKNAATCSHDSSQATPFRIPADGPPTISRSQSVKYTHRPSVATNINACLKVSRSITRSYSLKSKKAMSTNTYGCSTSNAVSSVSRSKSLKSPRSKDLIRPEVCSTVHEPRSLRKYNVNPSITSKPNETNSSDVKFINSNKTNGTNVNHRRIYKIQNHIQFVSTKVAMPTDLQNVKSANQIIEHLDTGSISERNKEASQIETDGKRRESSEAESYEISSRSSKLCTYGSTHVDTRNCESVNNTCLSNGPETDQLNAHDTAATGKSIQMELVSNMTALLVLSRVESIRVVNEEIRSKLPPIAEHESSMVPEVEAIKEPMADTTVKPTTNVTREVRESGEHEEVDIESNDFNNIEGGGSCEHEEVDSKTICLSKSLTATGISEKTFKETARNECFPQNLDTQEEMTVRDDESIKQDTESNIEISTTVQISSAMCTPHVIPMSTSNQTTRTSTTRTTSTARQSATTSNRQQAPVRSINASVIRRGDNRNYGPNVHVNFKKSEIQITVAMLVVSIGLLLSFIPYFTSTIYVKFLSTADLTLDASSNLMIRCAFINSVMNSIIYYIFSAAYRKYVNNLIRCKCRAK